MKKLKFIIPGIITTILLLIIFYYQGLYPFTNNSIVQVDADFQFIPVLYHIYDFLHGNANIIYNDIGLGNNIYISMIIQGSIFSPLSLLLYLTPRNNIINFYNIIVIIKISLIALTTYIYINRTFKVNEYYKTTFSILYALSGWVLLNYFNIMWLDSIILFPLIIMYLDDLFNKEKYLGYIITLSLSLIISYYISYFILLFILFYSFIYIFLKLDKDKVKKTIFRLGISTLIAILISSFSILPALYQTITSSRLEDTGSNIIFYNFMNKSLYLMFSSVFLVIFTKLIFKYKKDRKNIYIYLLLFILFTIGIFIEPINLALHMGSYWSFPYRYSFIPIFILLCGSLYYIERYGFNSNKKYQGLRFIIFIILEISILYLNHQFYKDIVDSQVVLDFDNFDIYINIIIIFSIIILMTIISLSFNNNKLRYITFTTVCLIQIFIYSSYTMYYSDGYYLTKHSNSINNNLNIIHSKLDRYKMGYTYYTPDYGFIYQVNTLDNWLHILPSKEITTYRNLGYKTTDTCIRSYGGTIFTDWLFNVKYLIDTEEQNNDMLSLKDNYNNYYLYEYNYHNTFGLLYNKDDIDYNDLSNFNLHNAIYKELLNKEDNIIKIDTYNYENKDKPITIDYNIKEQGFLYMYLYGEANYIKVNDKYIDAEDYDYIIPLGMYNDSVKIEIDADNTNNLILDLGFIKYKDIMNLNGNIDNVEKTSNGYNIKVNNNLDNGYLFLPINNIKGLKAKLNNRNIKIDSYLDNFVSIKLDKGINNLEITYEMPLFKLGIILSIMGIILLLLFNKIPSNKIILNITYYLYIITSLSFYIYIYGLSFFKHYNG